MPVGVRVPDELEWEANPLRLFLLFLSLPAHLSRSARPAELELELDDEVDEDECERRDIRNPASDADTVFVEGGGYVNEVYDDGGRGRE